jgi:hypothetical protein
MSGHDRIIGLLLGELDLSAGVGVRLYDAGDRWAKVTGRSEFEFVDRAMMLYAGALYKLDPDAARTYLHSLAERLDTETSSSERRQAEQRKLSAFERLAAAVEAAPDPGDGA